MSVLISVFGERGYSRYRLPFCRNTDYSLWLSDETFQIEKPLRILLENIDQIWYIRSSAEYLLPASGQKRKPLTVDTGFDLKSSSGDVFSFSVHEVPYHCSPYDKFYLRDNICIGRGRDNDIVIRGQEAVSRLHAKLYQSEGGWFLDCRGINGLYVNDRFISSRTELGFGDHINLMGLQMVFLEEYIAVETGLLDVGITLIPVGHTGDDKRTLPCDGTTAGGGHREHITGIKVIHRSPRSLKSVEEDPIVIDPPPEQDFTEDMPAAVMIASNILMTFPMVAGSCFMIYASGREGGNQLYMYGGLLMALLSLLSSLIWVLIQSIYNRRRDAGRWKKNKEAYHLYLKQKEKEIRERSAGIRELLEERYIRAENRTALDDSSISLWNRMPCHIDFLDCRLGTGDMKLPAEISIPEFHFRTMNNDLESTVEDLRHKYLILPDMPIRISLKEHSRVGLAALREKDRVSLARNMIIQLACNNCYTEVRLGLVYDKESSVCGKDWDFMRWLPHVWSEDGSRRLLASGHQEARGLFFHLLGRLRKREEGAAATIPVYVLFIDAPHYLEGEPIERYFTEGQTHNGIVVVWLAPERELLSNSCQLILEKSPEFQGICHLAEGRRTPVCFDEIPWKEADIFARRMSLFRVIERTEDNEIPPAVTFFQLFDIAGPEELEIAGKWKKTRVVDSLRAPIGLKAGGRMKYLDIHEKYHGPHGLVAGTTGSGKSELLQTYILSLLVLFSPRVVNLFLIDYKGGGLSGLFEGLPHLCGQISNLSQGGIPRAMTALRSENQRRQKLFKEYRVNNISDYMRLYYSRDDMMPVPHLLIIIDEFAELKKEEPDFMQELISIAQVGRSSGLHLILATQKPGGTVDDKIWSNARFRMCLRVQERQDSIDMLHRPDAADLRRTGRCCFQVGNDEIYEVFQTGWSGAGYRETKEASEIVSLVSFSGEKEYLPNKKEEVAGSKQTQFDVIRKHIILTAEKEGLAKCRQLWLDPLPARLTLDEISSGPGQGRREPDLKEPSGNGPSGYNPSGGCRRVCIGLADDPAHQRQFPVFLNLERHTAVCGLPGSGKTTFLQTLLYGTISHYSAGEVQIYILDFSNSSLKAFERMPQTGGVITGEEADNCRAFFHLVNQLLRERKKLFAGANYRQYICSGRATLPGILIVIDNYSSFSEKTGQRYEEDLIKLCREGENAGMTLLVTCGGFSSSELPHHFSDYFKECYCLEQKEHFSCTEILGTLDISIFPEKGIKGRGLARIEGDILEFQTALALDSCDDYDRMQKICREADRQTGNYKGILPVPLKVIPKEPCLSVFIRNNEVRRVLCEEDLLPAGYEVETAGIASISTRTPGAFLITGGKKAGKHSLFKLLLEILMLKKQMQPDREMVLCVVDFSGAFAAGRENAIDLYLDGKESPESLMGKIRQLLTNCDPGKNSPRVFILIENLGMFCALQEEERAAAEGSPMEMEDYKNLFIIVLAKEEDCLLAGESKVWQGRGPGAYGIHLGGSLIEDVVFDHGALSYEEQTAVLKPGTGYLFREGKPPELIMVPKPE